MSKEKILSAYNALSKNYNALIEIKPHNAFYDLPNTMSLLPEVKGKKILDAGCGPGRYAEILMGNGADVIGVDLSPNMIKEAKKRNKEKGQFYVHDLCKPFKMIENGSIDIVLSALVLHSIPDWTDTIREFQRVLKPGGIVIVSMEHPFFDYKYFKSEKYFDVEHVTCTWKGFGLPVEMHSYRRPLGSCISPFTENGFYIDKLIEPKPIPEFEHHDPKHWKQLNEFPSFMCLRAKRKL
ncbi:MAG: class I SAM-dependent methyltransferase [Saprospiraceae bacterium]|nr:class I SAM-dependent methyltransferase [Saprospiraceae bacterium]